MNNITAFVDSVGRVIVGQPVETDNDDTLKIKEPAVVNVQVNQQSGQISVQLLPFIFREFVSPDSREQGVVWSFQKSSVVTSENLELDDAIKNQYKGIFSKPVGTAETAGKEQKDPEVVKLFDDED